MSGRSRRKRCTIRSKSLAERRTGRGALQILNELDVGVLALSRDLNVTYANARWESWLDRTVAVGMSLASLLDEGAGVVLDELRAMMSSDDPGTIQLVLRPAREGGPTRRVDCRVRRVNDGLIVEAHAEGDGDYLGIHDIARRLAEVTDMAEVLRALCDIAMRQCAATGAAVLRARGPLGEVVAATGSLSPSSGRHFDLEGSLLTEAIEGGAIVSEDNFIESGRPLMRVVPELALGPMIVSPLRAHGETLGVLAVAREVGGQPFREREVQRLRVLADHAALAVHKSLLLLQAQSADQAKGRFLATMSHELRTPLTALAGYNELLADQVIGPMSEPQLDILERMRSVTTHLGAMIEEILAFTSLEEGRETVRATEFLAEDLVRSAAAIVAPLAEHKHLTVELVLPTTSVRMTNDIDKARQILVNLIGNAVKFTEEGTLTIRLSQRGTAVRFDVQDTGIGIPDEDLMRLFRPFAQVDTSLTRRYGGTGLGLYISRRLATLLGGHIQVLSKVGAGSTFSVLLPQVWEGQS